MTIQDVSAVHKSWGSFLLTTKCTVQNLNQALASKIVHNTLLNTAGIDSLDFGCQMGILLSHRKIAMLEYSKESHSI